MRWLITTWHTPMITEIRSKDAKKLFALLLDLEGLKEGSFGVTDPRWSLQLLLMNRKKGHVVKKHMHKKILKSTKQPQEAIIVVKGEIVASIFDRKGVLLAKKEVRAGQCLLILDGAHEVVFKKDSLAYAFKDGPYVDDKIAL